ncbi:hypothetical protein DPMN_142609 [Dreissena polymorpha]|uniref:Uncharacterized protein n=1 Tax=Dreissena polymorpha TaxID=45954 RepID=A0A9D4GBL3_DREPO|nr:hypothetical protein DPMN_142609 [Dreissena polymorpha]
MMCNDDDYDDATAADNNDDDDLLQIETCSEIIHIHFTTHRQIVEKYYSMKDKTRNKNDEMRRPGTIGGPRVKWLTISESIVLKLFADSAPPSGFQTQMVIGMYVSTKL